MPFEIHVDLSVQFIDQDKFLTEMQRQLRRLMREAAAIYYNNIMARLPVDTGFLAGSFTPIREVSGATGTPRSFPSKQTASRSVYTHFGDRRTPKNLHTGVEYVTKTAEILNEITDTQTRYLIVFHFSNEIRYYPINDIYGVKQAPWRITEKAIRAALAFIDANLPNIVNNVSKVSVKQQLISYRPGRASQKIRVKGA